MMMKMMMDGNNDDKKTLQRKYDNKNHDNDQGKW